MADFTLTRRIDASPRSSSTRSPTTGATPDYTPIRRAVLEREGDEEPNGKGAIRALHLAGPPMRERVIAFERPGLFTYELLSGLPVKDHVGTVTLEAQDGGTLMSYRVETTPTIPLSGPVVVGGMKVAIGRLMAAVQREAESRPAPAPASSA